MSAKPDIHTTTRMYRLYRSGNSISEVAKVFGVSRQSVFKRFARAGLPRRSVQPRESVQFNGRRYTMRDNGYFCATTGKRSALHRDVYEHHFGPIPWGWDIHHLDEDRYNNHIDNLKCLRKGEHTKLHGFKNNQHTIRKRQ